MSGLARYLTAAVLVRGADSGATVGLVLLAAHQRLPAVMGGLLIAALNAPHLLGPWLAARLDKAIQRPRLLAGAYLLYGIALSGGALAITRLPAIVALLAVGVAGCCGPLLTGGLSSVLDDLGASRRNQGWDALSYGIGGTAGPAAVAGLAGLTGPLPAVLGLAAATLVASALILTLPLGDTPAHRDPVGLRAGLKSLVAVPPLRRVTVLTLLSAVQLGALPVVAVALGHELYDSATAGAALTVAYGAGGLAGSALVTAWPLRGEPEILAVRLFASLAVVTVLCALTTSYPTAITGFAVLGLVNATSFTATLTARTRYAPPGARAQVFVTSAGLKVAMAALGAALAGAAAELGGRALLICTAAITLTAVATTVLDRRLTARKHRRREQAHVVAEPRQERTSGV
ncbi:MFS transporter [Amycolatopsis regifaucium]|uniref:MFS transporter n=1 Tax=Amycolatopsis regifaucium TaxID=546365 RepID=A0ABX3DIK8_9PSEU|nr:MFS transporter [Amycolatopsis regifaucium]OKA03868.1 MFS transporter [Amycolatopsis regifaucium]SFJ65367.1 Predicted arabinose efflux permease, MFS family [Amycolatopsis regifaucium]